MFCEKIKQTDQNCFCHFYIRGILLKNFYVRNSMKNQRKFCVTIGIKPSPSDCEAEAIQQQRATTTVKKITTLLHVP